MLLVEAADELTQQTAALVAAAVKKKPTNSLPRAYCNIVYRYLYPVPK